MIRFRCLPLSPVFVVLLIVAGPARSDLAGNSAREVAERLGRGVRGTASCRAARHVDDAARTIARHPSAGTQLTTLGQSSRRAMAALSSRNARRLAMLAEDGALARSGRWGELLAVIERHGDRAMDFIWRHKGALAVTSALGTFLSDPEAFLGDSRVLAEGAASEATRPIAVVASVTASRWVKIAWSVVVASLTFPAMMAVLLLSVRVVRQLRRRSNR